MGMPGTAFNIADELAKKQKEISVSEFFERNKQLLGFDSPTRAIITSVKEAVDNSLDACEEAGILPEIEITIEEVNKKRNIYRLTVEDNGPGIVRKQIPNVFGRLLYGSRFHAIRQSRGQQGIGISAVVMYAQLTTGRATVVRSKTGPDRPPHEIELKLDTKRNLPDVLRDEVILWDEKEHGIHFECHLVGRYQRGKQSAYEYLRSTAIVNPHSRILFREPDGRVVTFHRATDRLPMPAKEIKPHPQGTMLGTLLKMAKATKEHKMTNFLQKEFTRVSARVAKEMVAKGYIDPDMRPADLSGEQGERLVQAFHGVKMMAPPTDCLSPIGPILVRKGLKKETSSDFIVTSTRPSSVYSGHPFQVEAGLVYGGGLPKEDSIQILRFANRVPLLYQQGGCAITHAIEKVNWRRYGLDQRGGKGIPHGPMMLMVHVASTQIPFTSESKEAVADDPEILVEIDKALRDIGRRLQRHVKKKERLAKMKDKEDLIRQVLPLIAEKSAEILDRPVPPIEPIIAKIMNMVLLHGAIEYDEKHRRHKVTVDVTNYTRTAKTFTLYALMETSLDFGEISPKPRIQAPDLVGWRLSKMKVGSKQELSLELIDTDPDDFSMDDLDLYVDGLDPELANGVEAWDQDAYDEMRRQSTGEHAEGWVEVDDSALVEPQAPEEPEEEAEEESETPPEPEAVEPEEPEEPEEAKAEEESKTEEDSPSDEVDELEEPEGTEPWELNGELGLEDEGVAAKVPVKVAHMAKPDRTEADGVKVPEPEAPGDDAPATKQAAIVDYDDEFRMEVSD
jgi:DNA topoisomerase-6 subunit B